MSEIIAAVLGALLAGPAGFFIDRFFSRPRISLNYARIGYEDVIALTSEVHDILMQMENFVTWMDSQVPWNFKQCANGNYFTIDEIRIMRDLSRHYLSITRATVSRLEAFLTTFKSEDEEERFRAVIRFTEDYKKSFDGSIHEDYQNNPEMVIGRLKAYTEALIMSNYQYVFPWFENLIAECDVHLERRRGTSNRLVVRVGIGNRGIQDGLIEAEASLNVAGRDYRLPVKPTKRPWDTEAEDGAALDSSFLRLPARSFRVLDFLIDENLNVPADLKELIPELRRGGRAQITTYGLGRKEIASITFSARLPVVHEAA